MTTKLGGVAANNGMFVKNIITISREYRIMHTEGTNWPQVGQCKSDYLYYKNLMLLIILKGYPYN